nr:uncharacterized protein CTRU02_04694 [Colletotrichum truncatum]KAF6795131.1 hypothetical protein CTRU02_04694 [Colletotrichum truncatum]
MRASLLAGGLDHPVDPVASAVAEPAASVTGHLGQSQDVDAVAAVLAGLKGRLGVLGPDSAVNDVHSARPLARGLDANVLGLRDRLPLGVGLRQQVPDGQWVMQRETGLLAVSFHGIDLLKGLGHEVVNPLAKRAAGLHDGLDALREVVLHEEMGRGDVEREERQLQRLGELGRVRRERRLLVRDGRHGRPRVGGGQSKDSSRRNRVGKGVEFADGGDVTLDVDCTAHDAQLLDAEEGLGVLGGGECDVRHRPDDANGNGVWGVLPEDAQNLLVCNLLGGREVLVEWGRVVVNVLLRVEKRLPPLIRGKVRVSLVHAV